MRDGLNASTKKIGSGEKGLWTRCRSLIPGGRWHIVGRAQNFSIPSDSYSDCRTVVIVGMRTL